MESPEYMDSPECDVNPSPPPEFADNPELLQAESIGNTAFSKHWLFSTLIKFIEEVDRETEEESNLAVDVDEDLQNELCKLWDMSMNSDVAMFLNEFKAVDILTGIIEKSKAPRVIEISVGILGNMACEAAVCKEMADNQKFIDLVILMMETRDVPTLVENTRLIYTSLSNTVTRGPWIRAIQRSEDILDHLKFIFSSSTNCDLLKNTAELVDTLLDCEPDLCVSWATIDFVHSLIEATEQIGSNHSDALEVYLHILQSFSTTESGVEAL
ncbi:protein saal1-like, partial [Ruditapes philippinarum]